MKLHRRDLLTRAGMLALAAKAAPAASKSTPEPLTRSDFPVAETQTYLNNAGWHPTPLSSLRAMQEYLDYKAKATGDGSSPRRQSDVKELFAKLINAAPSEIAFVPSTMGGENIVVNGLGIPQGSGNVVTDALHFEGSTYLYRTLEKQGLDLRVVLPREGRIELRDLEKVVDRKTRLIALSLVSYVNGFKQDLKAVSDLAHAHGAYLYADIVQAAGSTPVDVRAAGVDFCAASAYKWLMGDMGIGFLYAREDLLGRVLRATQYGHRQYHNFEHHIFPYERPDPAPATWERYSDARGYFEVGTISNIVVACLSESLKNITKLGVEKIRAHAKPLTDRLQKELPAMGFRPMTPPDTPTPIVTFAVKDPEAVAAKLKKANVTVKIVQHQMRISPSVYSDQRDIDRLLAALS